ncbi:MAG: N-ethylammeline chlorohydrolase, partial [Firmicutes bacterium]|nr:N-ethylammeline chlorohydrolase [Bacillota bacterium]
MKTLFTNACLLLRSVEGSYYAFKDACLGIDGKYIAYIGKDKPEGLWDAVKDMSGKLIIPGLVNAHGHAAMTLLRGVGSGLPLQRWLNEAIFPIEAKMKPEDIIAGTRWA